MNVYLYNLILIEQIILLLFSIILLSLPLYAMYKINKFFKKRLGGKNDN